MGTGAVYVTLSGLKEHSSTLTTVETIFYFLNISLFLLNTTTLMIQAIREFLIEEMIETILTRFSVPEAGLEADQRSRERNIRPARRN